MPTRYVQYPWVHAAGDGGKRAVTQMIVIHATDNTASAKNEAGYASHRADRISAHFYIDDTTIYQSLLTDHVAYGCYPQGNSRSIQLELCGRSNRLSGAVQRRAAKLVARLCIDNKIPVYHVGPVGLRAGVKGICGHGDVTKAWGQGDHTDPGANFNWAGFIVLVKAEYNRLKGIQTTAAVYYTIKSGDTMTGIAQKYGMTLDKLLALNPGYKTRPDLIMPGNRVRVR